MIQKFCQTGATLDDQLAAQLASDPVIIQLKYDFKQALPSLLSDFQLWLSEASWGRLQYEAHSVKGSAGSMGYPELTELMSGLELAAQQADTELATQLVSQFAALVAAENSTEQERINEQ